MTRLFLLLLLSLPLVGCLNTGTSADDDDVAANDDDATDDDDTVLCADYDGCDVNATCSDTDDGPVCTCDEGWEGDGATCEDVDECEIDNGGCHEAAICTNTEGSRTCECPEGWDGDGLDCVQRPYWELVGSTPIQWATNWGPDTVVAAGDTIVWGTETAAGTDSTLHRFDVTDGSTEDFGGGTYDLCACGYTQASAVLDGYLYLFGNAGARIDLGGTNASWEAVTAYPAARQRGEAGITVFGDDLYLFGGRGPLDSTQSYSGGVAGSWMDHAAIPYTVDSARPVVVGDDIYLVGGTNETVDESRLARFTPSSDTWMVLSNSPAGEGRTQNAGLLGDQLWMHQRGEIFFYTPATDVWDPAPLRTPQLDQVAVVEIGGVLHAIGGDATTTEVHRYVIP